MDSKAEALEKRIVAAFQPIYPAFPMATQARQNIDSLSGEFESLARLVGGLCPESRETALALTKLEEAYMFTAAAITRADGVNITPSNIPPEEPNREMEKVQG